MFAVGSDGAACVESNDVSRNEWPMDPKLMTCEKAEALTSAQHRDWVVPSMSSQDAQSSAPISRHELLEATNVLLTVIGRDDGTNEQRAVEMENLHQLEKVVDGDVSELKSSEHDER